MSEYFASILGSILVATVAIYAQAAIKAPCTFTTYKISTLIGSSSWLRWASTQATSKPDTQCAPFKYHASCPAYAHLATTAIRCSAYASTALIISTCLLMMANSAHEILTKTFWTWVWAPTFDIVLFIFLYITRIHLVIWNLVYI